MVWLAPARSSVWPSGGAFATEALPIVPPARAEHHGRRASIHLQQVARVGVVRGSARLGLRAEMAPADLEHALHPFLLGRGPYRRHVGEHVELGFFFQKLSYPGEQGLV